MPDVDQWIQRERERVRTWRSKKSAAGRDIGRLPPIAHPRRRKDCSRSLERFAKTYFPHTFDKPFCNDHRKVFVSTQNAVLEGGLFAMAMPRGTGKTTICEVAAIWAALYGYHQFIVLIGATAAGGKKMLDSIKSELRTNDLLLEDFPEVCFPIRSLEGITNRSAGQRFAGESTYIGWRDKQIVLPTIAGSQASGAVMQVFGLTSDGIRGLKFKKPDGSNIRPTLVILDDPQTDKSARNPKQCDKREEIVCGAILGLAGPGQKIAAIMPCTVIEEGDMADRMLDRQLHPEWNGIRTKTLYSMPKHEAMWNEYAEIRADSMRRGNNGREATAFYKKNRKKMDEGAEAAWKERFRDDELSAIQCAMNLFYRNRAAFAAEAQNEPLKRNAGCDVKMLTATEIADKLNHCPRGVVPAECTVVNAHIDVQQDVLFWMVCAWAPDFGGAIVDYGTWPDQNRAYFTLTDLRRTIADEVPGDAGLDGRLYAAYKACTAELLGREFTRQDGAQLRISREMIDGNWGKSTRGVYKFCRESPHAALLLPGHGRYIGASSRRISEQQRKTGEKYGEEWVLGRPNSARAIRHLTYDTNYWKSFVHERLATAPGDRGTLMLFGDKPAAQRMLADHLVSEKPIRVTAKGRTVDEWHLPPHKPDNHWLDNLVGCAVLASLEGCEVLTHTTPPPQPRPASTRKKVKYQD